MNVSPKAAVIGGGPAGLMAAEVLARGGVAVTVYDRMPSVGRKFLMAGRGGLNLTHGEALPQFLARYGDVATPLRTAIERFRPDDLRAWSEGLGEPTFAGSSGRVFPKSFKASPLLRAWLRRLSEAGVVFKLRHMWLDGDSGVAELDTHHLIKGGIESKFDQVFVFECRDGKFTRLQSYVPYPPHGIAGMIGNVTKVMWRLQGKMK